MQWTFYENIMNNTPRTNKGIIAGLGAVALLLIYYAGSAFTPFLLSFIIAYILDPLVDRLESLGLPRTPAIFFFLIVVLLFCAFLIFLLLPMMQLQLENMAHHLPAYIQIAQDIVAPWILFFSDQPDKIQDFFREILLKIGGVPMNLLSSLAAFFWGAFSGVVNFAVTALNLVIIPVATFYLLRDIDTIKTKTIDLIPPAVREPALRLVRNLHDVLRNFIRGQMTVVCIQAVVYSVGLFMIGVPMSLLIGLVAGLASMVPYLGLLLGLAPALALSFLQFHDLLHPVLVCLVFGTAQALEALVITPKIVGEKLGLHPVVIMFSVLLGGRIFGFTGVLLAVPATAALNVFWQEFLATYKRSETYLGKKS